MQINQNSFDEKYEELHLLGRGNYGSAFVVEERKTKKLYVSKKMNLDGMNESQIQAAKGEIQILEKFSDTKMYPFIVKYYECFLYEKTLIIIMEYCEFGDLATFLKNAKKKGEYLEEKVILAWLVMIAMGIRSLHSKNILHRDLKSANIFLTSNKFIKIGDFGISKVLDTTSAKTFVGTPYYLSPELCSNKKYDLRSDIWSLGCILYELCTLTYPFNANNIVSLAMKITSQQVQPIPSSYSKELNEIVLGLLIKDQDKRKTLDQIMETPLLKKFICENGNKIEQICQTIPLKRTTQFKAENQPQNNTNAKSFKSSQAQNTMQTIRSNFQQTNNNSTFELSTTNASNLMETKKLNPREQMQRRKQQKIKQQQETLKKAAMDNLEIRKFTESRKKQQLFGSYSNKNQSTHFADTYRKKIQNQNLQIAEEKRNAKKGLGANQSIDLASLFELTSQIKDLGLTNKTSSNQLSEAVQKKVKENSNFRQYTEHIEEQIIDEEIEEYLEEPFEDFVPDQKSKIFQAQEEKEAVGVFMSVYAGNQQGISPTKRANVEKAFQKKQFGQKSTEEKKHSFMEECIQIVGKQRFKLLYDLVSSCYKNGNYFENAQLKQLRKNGSNSEKKALQLIQQIKYLES